MANRNLTDALQGEDLTTVQTIATGVAYSKTLLDGGQLDNRYYTETELNAGQLDTRYYTETEQDVTDDAQDVAIGLRATTAYVNAKPTGQKNLLINGRKLIQQRGVTGGTKQVVLNTANLGGVHTISFTGTATATIKEATTLGASDALTTWDTALAIAVSSGTTVTLTAGKYVHVEFSTTDFDFAQLELGSVDTDYALLEDTLDECLPYYEQELGTTALHNHGATAHVAAIFTTVSFKFEKINTPIVSKTLSLATESSIVINKSSFLFNGAATSTSAARMTDWKANGEIFNADDGVGINYKEDRWYV